MALLYFQPLPVESFTKRAVVMELRFISVKTNNDKMKNNKDSLDQLYDQQDVFDESDLDFFWVFFLIRPPLLFPALSSYTPSSETKEKEENNSFTSMNIHKQYSPLMEPVWFFFFINASVAVPDVHPSPSNTSVAKEKKQNKFTTSVNICKRYFSLTEPNTPTRKSMKGLNVKNPGFKRHRSYFTSKQRTLIN